MTAEQLQHARAAAWRQEGNALLTADDVASWLREAGLVLFLPRTAQLKAPAGSFVEATAGEADPTPKPAAIENATGLLRRLLATGDVVALNLLGIPGDQPDFLATEDTLPFLFALRGDREWKRGPRGKSSPLVVEVWKALDRDGALTADAVKEKLGRHLTESAALRALTELWTTMRIEPVYSEAEGTRWQLLEADHEKAMIAGSAMAQGMALSALVSLYLQTAVAATLEEIEAYLSPVASRSRIRDAVRGLTATRQLSIRNLGAHEHFYVEGSLPAFADEAAGAASTRAGAELPGSSPVPDMLPEVEAPADIVVAGEEGSFRIEALSEQETEYERTVGEGRKRFVAQRGAGSGDRREFGPKPGARPGARPGAPRKTFGSAPRPGGERKTFGVSRPDSRSGSRPDSRPDARPGAERKTFGAVKPDGPRKTFTRAPGFPAAQGEEKGFHAREPWKEDRKPFAPRDGERPAAAGGERKPFAPREGGRPGSFKPGARKTFTPREGGRPAAFGSADRKPFTPREGGRPTSFNGGDRKPFKPREGGRPASFSGGDRKPFAPREGGRPASFSGGDRKPFTPREGGRPASFNGGDRKPFVPREGGRPASFGGGERKPFTPREGGRPASFGGGDRKPFTPREGGRAASFSGGERKPFTPREGGRPASFGGGDRKPFTPREGGRPASFGGGERKPFAPRTGSRDGSETPRRTGAPGAGAPKRFSPEAGRPTRPGAPTGKPGGKRPRTAAFTSSGKPRAGVSATGRPGPRANRPGKPASGRKPGAPPRRPGGKPAGSSPRRDG